MIIPYVVATESHPVRAWNAKIEEVDLDSEHCTTGQPECELCKHFVQMLQLLVVNHTVLVL
jgi:hypothetical protein